MAISWNGARIGQRCDCQTAGHPESRRFAPSHLILRLLLAGTIPLCLTAPSQASETIQYTYDALGRLVEVSRGGAVNEGATSTYQYDPAGNRQNVAATTAWTSNSRHAGDFNGDGRYDVLWRDDAGSMSDWLGTTAGGFTNNDANAWSDVPTYWHIAGVGDFNGDGRADLLWRNDSGAVTDWLGTAAGGFINNDANALRPAGTDYRVVGIGDFNGDGRRDILWRNTSGSISDWLGNSNGGFTVNDTNALTAVALTWTVVGVGDFNGDGRADILWRSSTGIVAEWVGQASGGFAVNNNVNTQVDLTWKVVGVGDFNGDHASDILWRNDDGTLSDWLGTTGTGAFVANNSAAAVFVPTVWRVASIGDFNGDGRDDILWRSTTGTTTDWLGTTSGAFVINDANSLSNVPTYWNVEPR